MKSVRLMEFSSLGHRATNARQFVSLFESVGVRVILDVSTAHRSRGRVLLKGLWGVIRSRQSVFLPSADDHFVALLAVSLLRAILGRSTVLHYYQVHAILQAHSLRQRVKRFIFELAQLAPSDRLIFTFSNEDCIPELCGRSNIRFLPDVQLSDCMSDSVRWNDRTQPFTVLLAGYISRRKGLALIVRAVRNLASDGVPIRLRLVGLRDSFEESVETDLAVLRVLGALDDVSEEVSDQRFIEELIRADAICALYDHTFLATSGLVGRAAQLGVPIIGGSHGWIGSACRAYGLGQTVPIDEPREIESALMRLMNARGPIDEVARARFHRDFSRSRLISYLARIVEQMGSA